MFNKYSSIENHYNSKFIEKIRWQLSDDIEWVAREKIHGANFQIIITKDKVEFAKRSGVIPELESFYGHIEVMKRYKDAIDYIRDIYKDEFEIFKSINIYGEIAGDGIQSNTPYGPKDFYVFDIMKVLFDKTEDGDNKIQFVDDNIAELMAISAGFKVAPLLGRGKLEDLFKINPEFKSIVTTAKPAIINIVEPSDEADTEGYVLKPNKAQWLGQSRVIIKVKSKAHAEKTNGKSKPVKVAGPVVFTDNDIKIIDTISQYVNAARVKNVLSHGDVVLNEKTFGKVFGVVLADILEEYTRETEFPNPLRELDSSKDAMKVIQKEIMSVIRDVWKENM